MVIRTHELLSGLKINSSQILAALTLQRLNVLCLCRSHMKEEKRTCLVRVNQKKGATYWDFTVAKRQS